MKSCWQQFSREVGYLSGNVGEQLPATVLANYAKGDPQQVPVTWNAESVSVIDTGVVGTYTITGTVDGFEEEVTAEIKVVYRVVYRFDFCINEKEETEGWTGFTVNGKGGTKTAAELGIDYNAERGYGFLDGAAVVEGMALNVIVKLNIELLKYIDDEAPRPITEAKVEIPLVITIPEEYRTAAEGYEREFFMVRTHVTQDGNGNDIVQVDILKDQDSDSATITIATDKFSVYALSYKDVPVETDETEEDQGGQSVTGSSSKTGDQTNVWVWIILLAICVAGAGAFFGVKFYRNKKQK